MNTKILTLKELWKWENSPLATKAEIRSFQSSTGLLIPNDLEEYFLRVNGSNGYDDGFFEFYSLADFKNIKERFDDWSDLNCTEFYENVSEPLSCFIFAEFQIHLLVFGIVLNKIDKKGNDIYVFCGDKHKLIAGSFNDFIDLCIEDPMMLYF